MTEYQGLAAILGIIFAVISFACIVIGTPVAVYYSVQASRHTVGDLRELNFFYKLNKLNIVFAPSKLNATGLEYRRKFNRVGTVIVIGWICGAAAFWIL